MMLSKHVASLFALLVAAPLCVQTAYAATPSKDTTTDDAKAPKSVSTTTKDREKKDAASEKESKHEKHHRVHARKHNRETAKQDGKKAEAGKAALIAKHEPSKREVEHGREPVASPVAMVVEVPKKANKKHGKIEKVEKNDRSDAKIRASIDPKVELVPMSAATIVGVGNETAAPLKDLGKKSADRIAGKRAKPPCMHEAIDVLRGTEQGSFSLTKCDGSIAPLAMEQLSILARPTSAPKPAAPLASLAKIKGNEIAPGIKRMDSNLAVRLQTMIDHFAKPGTTPRLFVISGYRPSAAGSYHASGHALDFRIDGVKNEELVAFCKTLPDTGCGFYPNSSFVHVDVRPSGTGHVAWIDASGPGESPRYVASWPPPAVKDEDEKTDSNDESILARLDKDLPPLPADEHPAETTTAKSDTDAKREAVTKSTPAANAPPAELVDDQTP